MRKYHHDVAQHRRHLLHSSYLCLRKNMYGRTCSIKPQLTRNATKSTTMLVAFASNGASLSIVYMTYTLKTCLLRRGCEAAGRDTGLCGCRTSHRSHHGGFKIDVHMIWSTTVIREPIVEFAVSGYGGRTASAWWNVGAGHVSLRWVIVTSRYIWRIFLIPTSDYEVRVCTYI